MRTRTRSLRCASGIRGRRTTGCGSWHGSSRKAACNPGTPRPARRTGPPPRRGPGHRHPPVSKSREAGASARHLRTRISQPSTGARWHRTLSRCAVRPSARQAARHHRPRRRLPERAAMAVRCAVRCARAGVSLSRFAGRPAPLTRLRRVSNRVFTPSRRRQARSFVRPPRCRPGSCEASARSRRASVQPAAAPARPPARRNFHPRRPRRPRTCRRGCRWRRRHPHAPDEPNRCSYLPASRPFPHARHSRCLVARLQLPGPARHSRVAPGTGQTSRTANGSRPQYLGRRRTAGWPRRCRTRSGPNCRKSYPRMRNGRGRQARGRPLNRRLNR